MPRSKSFASKAILIQLIGKSGASFRPCPYEKVTGKPREEICVGCAEGQCEALFALGLDDIGDALEARHRPRCYAKTRKGWFCQLPVVPGKRRCRYHGGASTGPKTQEGRGRIAAAQRKRWAMHRAKRQAKQE